MSTVLGIDVGSTATKAVLVAADGVLLASATLEHQVGTPAAGRYEHDADLVWWHDVARIARKVIALTDGDVTVEAVGLSACGPCIVPVDADGNPLRPGILYGVDTRATSQVDRLVGRIGEAEILTAFGMPLTSQSVGPKLQWMYEEEPDLYARTAAFLTANGYAAFRLTGRQCVDHHQAAYFAPYYRNGQWDPAYDEADIVSRLPDLLWSTEVVGTVTPEASSLTGLPVGIPVTIGSSDGLTGAYGAGALRDGDAVLNYGTTLAVSIFASPGGPNIAGIWRTPGALPGQQSLAAGLSTGGALLSWFLKELARDLPAEGSLASSAYGQLAAEAGDSPAGGGGLLLLPYFAGERTPIYDPGAAGVLLGLRLHHTRGDIYRALLEGTAHGVRHVLDEMGKAAEIAAPVRAVGGGTATSLWMQIVSDVTGYTQQTVTPHHGSPIGAAFLAALGCGLTSGDTDLDGWVLPAQVITPDAGTKQIHDQRHAAYLDAYLRTRPLIEALGA